MSVKKLFTFFFMVALLGVCIHYYLNTSDQTIKLITGVSGGILVFGLLPTLVEYLGFSTH
jgi:hypothetical protein